ncbi:predicted coding region AF_0085 [Archaeoglobus fulgidus DSM 4304]|jgi:hypothetical protein|uniref:Uncharacterized protein AF_0085 n=3 Tax=Archaeoglobus fulgidus TaxID=2234 RepID=Y085_ARCFU|nr:RecName: Full=Uncharacterized protein AF_0085 [Archaeoglobus fulgidus DSM 4304]AAB91146.1 predicted coding region AF_0085 [Archaeoglobus fulgidus DSM 4304]AIG96925.1 hypothetical protein AFULGI_00000810 [Archaeoglobus fulgidus DSM 8774]KUK07467.1 MAG: Uncharacterized protein XD48_0246 [Archaeoglobus fulgidus]
MVARTIATFAGSTALTIKPFLVNLPVVICLAAYLVSQVFCLAGFCPDYLAELHLCTFFTFFTSFLLVPLAIFTLRKDGNFLRKRAVFTSYSCVYPPFRLGNPTCFYSYHWFLIHIPESLWLVNNGFGLRATCRLSSRRSQR